MSLWVARSEQTRWALKMDMALASVYVVGIWAGCGGEAASRGLRFTQCPVLSLKVCLCVAANVAHGLQQNVLYVDSNGGMTASRLLQLLQARTQDEEKQVGGKMAGFL